MTLTFIGDVHGNLPALERLLPQCQGECIFVGDLVDRGSDSKGVIDLVHELCQKGRARSVLGNHEFMLLRGLGFGDKPADSDFFSMWWHYGGAETAASFAIDRADPAAVRQAMDWRLEWIAQLPWLIEEPDWVVIHACLDPTRSWQAQRQELQNPQSWWQGQGLPPQLFDRHLRLPADWPGNRILVSGHTPVPKLIITQQRILCDTSGGRGLGPLSALIYPDLRSIATW